MKIKQIIDMLEKRGIENVKITFRKLTSREKAIHKHGAMRCDANGELFHQDKSSYQSINAHYILTEDEVNLASSCDKINCMFAALDELLGQPLSTGSQ